MKVEMGKTHKRPILNSLRKHRKFMRYKQKDVARLLNLHDTSQISRWEKGLSIPNAINLFKLSIIYRTFPNQLYVDLVVELRHEVIKKEKVIFKILE